MTVNVGRGGLWVGILAKRVWSARKKSLSSERPDRDISDVSYSPKSSATFLSMLRMGSW